MSLASRCADALLNPFFPGILLAILLYHRGFIILQNATPAASNDIYTMDELRTLDTLERIPCTLHSPKEFQRRYEIPRQPVILTDCASHWPANRLWTNAHQLIPRFSNTSQWRSSLHEDDSMHDTVDWETIVQAIQNEQPYYIFDQLQSGEKTALQKDYTTPAPFQGTDLYQSSFLANISYPPNYGPMRWFCMGSKLSGSLPHQDPHATDAWNTLVSGHKWWILFPPGMEEEDICPDDDECAQRLDAIDWYAQFGKSSSTTSSALHVLQRPGETLYVPFDRVHSVLNMEASISVTANFASIGNLDAILEDFEEEDLPELQYTLYQALLREGTHAHLLTPYAERFLTANPPTTLMNQGQCRKWERINEESHQ